jgi:alkanesulfonate monooxygenase SsuD/methylene tetrahydromethanopterin reductase-like flavin-dependent oxidoreductase (luciferase family)
VGLVVSPDREAIAELEAQAIDSLWVGGHIASSNPSPEAMQGLARLVALTERVRVGTSILLLPLYPPALVAKQIADLDRASSGRVMLGVGVGGEYPQEFRAMEVPLAERGPRADEAIPLLRKLWTAKAITHAGHHYAMDNVRIHPAPIQSGGPSIIVAGRREPAMRRAGRLGDGWFPYLYSPERYAASAEVVAASAAEAERDLASFEWCVFVFVNVDTDGRAAREGAARSIGRTYSQDIDRMVDRIAAAGTPAEVTARLRAFYDAGARHFVFCPATGGAPVDPMLRRLFGEVIPDLRDHAAAD